MGTIISSLVLWGYSYPKYVYKKLFNRSYLDYTKETVFYIIIFILIACTSYFLSSLLTTYNIYLTFITNVAICVLVPNILLFILFYKTDNFKYYLNLIKPIRRKG